MNSDELKAKTVWCNKYPRLLLEYIDFQTAKWWLHERCSVKQQQCPPWASTLFRSYASYPVSRRQPNFDMLTCYLMSPFDWTKILGAYSFLEQRAWRVTAAISLKNSTHPRLKKRPYSSGRTHFPIETLSTSFHFPATFWRIWQLTIYRLFIPDLLVQTS
jgi:hypothetical protein